jgi:hypothetical protein
VPKNCSRRRIKELIYVQLSLYLKTLVLSKSAFESGRRFFQVRSSLQPVMLAYTAKLSNLANILELANFQHAEALGKVCITWRATCLQSEP